MLSLERWFLIFVADCFYACLLYQVSCLSLSNYPHNTQYVPSYPNPMVTTSEQCYFLGLSPHQREIGEIIFCDTLVCVAAKMILTAAAYRLQPKRT